MPSLFVLSPRFHMTINIASRLFYWAGHFLFLALDAIASDWSHDAPEWFMDMLYRSYNQLMCWSSDVGPGEYIWLKRRDDENEEAFTMRCRERWPENHEMDPDLV